MRWLPLGAVLLVPGFGSNDDASGDEVSFVCKLVVAHQHKGASWLAPSEDVSSEDYQQDPFEILRSRELPINASNGFPPRIGSRYYVAGAQLYVPQFWGGEDIHWMDNAVYLDEHSPLWGMKLNESVLFDQLLARAPGGVTLRHKVVSEKSNAWYFDGIRFSLMGAPAYIVKNVSGWRMTDIGNARDRLTMLRYALPEHQQSIGNRTEYFALVDRFHNHIASQTSRTNDIHDYVFDEDGIRLMLNGNETAVFKSEALVRAMLFAVLNPINIQERTSILMIANLAQGAQSLAAEVNGLRSGFDGNSTANSPQDLEQNKSLRMSLWKLLWLTVGAAVLSLCYLVHRSCCKSRSVHFQPKAEQQHQQDGDEEVFLTPRARSSEEKRGDANGMA
eukprot:gnl/TRDRNA2_/TRDRNA2_185137_c0_seq1.p1 gnl/TRDRNA2_/TRDRNA2_185137_c0~~gnl/TRDRNA2_/TRDRNA2_185137_c0_seq1.p1  ORF type:complete len:390 (-),score=49.16 gnl/TRDRNA2_/TRDRNA2_185137_c0_seq1:126-1295(-)